MDLPAFRDFRNVPLRDQPGIRKWIVIRIRHGESITSMAASLRIESRTIRRWFASYLSSGFAGLVNKPRQGRPRIISQKKVESIRATVRDKDPSQLKFPFAYWTLKSVRKAILERFGTRISASTARRILKRL